MQVSIILPVCPKKFSNFGNASCDYYFLILFAPSPSYFKMKTNAYFSHQPSELQRINNTILTSWCWGVLCSSHLFSSDAIYSFFM